MDFADFKKLDIRVGTITAVRDFPEARKPAYILTIDLGPEIGIKKSSAQLPPSYTHGDLLNTQVVCLVNIPPRQVGPLLSEVLTLGLPDGDGHCVLVRPDRPIPNGGRVY